MAAVDFSLVIACYKDAPHLFRNVQALAAFFADIKLVVEYVFVEDASPDATADEVRKCARWLESAGLPARNNCPT